MTAKSRYTRRKRRSRRTYGATSIRIILILLFIGIVTSIAYSTCKKNAGEQRMSALAGEPELVQLALVDTPEITDGQMIHYPGFDIFFSPGDHQPYYGVWILTPENVNKTDVKRSNNFREDPDVEGSATPADYRGSGFDRGHIVPAGDNRYSKEAMEASFFMTNMSPQANALNAKAWNSLEDNCRNWTRRDGPLVIVAGPVLSDYLTTKIGRSGVTVPDRYFKVVLAPHADPPRAIGFIMNNGHVDGGVQASAVTVDQVEEITGFDFFAALPDEVENAIESEAKYTTWQRSNRKTKR